MGKHFFNREEAIEFYRMKLTNMLSFFEGQQPIDLETLKSLLSKENENHTNLIVEGLQLNKKAKNSTFLKNHFKNKHQEIQKLIDEAGMKCEVLETAVELCEVLKVNDTASFNSSLLNEEVLNKIIDYKIEQEKARNAEAEKTGGKKSKKFTNLYEEFDESEYAIFDLYK